MIIEKMKEEHLEEVKKLLQKWEYENITYGVVAGTLQQIAKAIRNFYSYNNYIIWTTQFFKSLD